MELVTMGEAAQRLGVSTDTVRRRLRRGELQRQHQPTPLGFIWLVQVPEHTSHAATRAYVTQTSRHAQADARARAVFNGADTIYDAVAAGGDPSALRKLADVLRHEIDTRDRQLEAKDGQLMSKDRQIGQLHL